MRRLTRYYRLCQCGKFFGNGAGNILLCGQDNKSLDKGTLEILFCPFGKLLDIKRDKIFYFVRVIKSLM